MAWGARSTGTLFHRLCCTVLDNYSRFSVPLSVPVKGILLQSPLPRHREMISRSNAGMNQAAFMSQNDRKRNESGEEAAKRKRASVDQRSAVMASDAQDRNLTVGNTWLHDRALNGNRGRWPIGPESHARSGINQHEDWMVGPSRSGGRGW